jgi:hypothetical protein
MAVRFALAHLQKIVYVHCVGAILARVTRIRAAWGEREGVFLIQLINTRQFRRATHTFHRNMRMHHK